MVKASLIAADTGIDFVGAAFLCLFRGIRGRRKDGRGKPCRHGRQRSFFRLFQGYDTVTVMSGILTFPIRRLVTQENPPRGTIVAMVGTRASCQPMPVLMRLAPAASILVAGNSISSQVLPSSTRSSMLGDRR